MSWFDIMLGFMVGGYFTALGLGIRGMKPVAAQGNKMVLAMGIFILIANLVITMVERQVTGVPVTPQQIVESFKKRLVLPVQMDAQTRLETIEAADDRVVYNFSISAADKAAYDAKVAEMRGYMSANGCTMQDSKLLMQAGLSMELRYHAPMKLGGEAVSLLLRPEDCGHHRKAGGTGR